MSLSPDQFNELLKGAGRRSKMTVGGERFIAHDTLKDSQTSPYPKESDASWGAGFVTSDGYGLGHTPVAGLRPVYSPSGDELEDVMTHKDGVSVIKQHRAGEHYTQKPREPRRFTGIPIGGFSEERKAEMARNVNRGERS